MLHGYPADRVDHYCTNAHSRLERAFMSRNWRLARDKEHPPLQIVNVTQQSIEKVPRVTLEAALGLLWA